MLSTLSSVLAGFVLFGRVIVAQLPIVDLGYTLHQASEFNVGILPMILVGV